MRHLLCCSSSKSSFRVFAKQKATNFACRTHMNPNACRFGYFIRNNLAMIYFLFKFVVVNFDALAQASNFRIERKQVVFLWWMQDSNPGSQTPNRQQTECPPTNRLSYRGSSQKSELDSPIISGHSAHSIPLPVGFRTWLWRYTCSFLLISMLWHRQAIFELKGDKLSSSAECRIRSQGLRHHIASKSKFEIETLHWSGR